MFFSQMKSPKSQLFILVCHVFFVNARVKGEGGGHSSQEMWIEITFLPCLSC